jgi:methylated-DNA-[protein]-cysteine S-methyltransferase
MDTKIFYKYLQTPIGCIEIISNDTHIQSVKFVEVMGINSLIQPQVLKDCCVQLQEYFEGTRKSFTIALQQNGTDFQQLVWKELLTIPFGKKTSYLTLSKQLGNAGAIRAVGTTNGKNKIAIIVPCHRVIGSDGKLTGYSGGLYRKQWLLEHEAKVMGISNLLF